MVNISREERNSSLSLDDLMSGFTEGTREGSFFDNTYDLLFVPAPFQRFLLKARRVVKGFSFHYEAKGYLLGGPNVDVKISNPKYAYALASQHFG